MKSFVKLMIDEMEQAKSDLDAAMSSIELDAAHAKPSQKFLSFESYVIPISLILLNLIFSGLEGRW